MSPYSKMKTIPEEWCLVRIKDDQHIGTKNDDLVKVFGSWRGDFATGDSWKLNSGIEHTSEEEDYYLFKGYSGSVYKCHKKTYGINSMYNSGVLMSFEDVEPMKGAAAVRWIRRRLKEDEKINE